MLKENKKFKIYLDFFDKFNLIFFFFSSKFWSAVCNVFLLTVIIDKKNKQKHLVIKRRKCANLMFKRLFLWNS